MTLLAVSSASGGTGNVTHIGITAPAGVVPSATTYLFCSLGLASITGVTFTYPPGFTAIGGPILQGSWVYILLEGTGVTAGDLLDVSWTNTISGKCGIILACESNAVVRDDISAIAATGTSATETVPGINTTEANERVLIFASGTGSVARTISGVSGATAQLTATAGGTNRFIAFNVSDNTIASVGPSGTITYTFSGTLLTFGGWQVSLKAAGGGGGSGTASKVRVSGTATAATHKDRVSGTATASPRKVRVAGVAV